MISPVRSHQEALKGVDEASRWSGGRQTPSRSIEREHVMNTKNHTQSNGHAAAHTNGKSHATVHVTASADPRQEQASEALADLARIKRELAPDRALSARERRYASKFARVNASSSSRPSARPRNKGLATFDATQKTTRSPTSASSSRWSRRSAARLQALEDTVHGRHQYAAEQALAVYASLKGLVRFTNDVGTQAQVEELFKLITTRKKGTAKAAARQRWRLPAAVSNDNAVTK